MTVLQTLELFCFGAPGARVDGGDPPRDVVWKKHLALLIYLALSPDRSRTREHLRGLLWPEKDEQLSRQSLNEAVRRLRIRLGDERLVTRGDVIEMSGERLSVDAVHLLELATRDPTKALAQVRGDFLEGFTVEDAPGFEEWAMHERERQHSRVAGILVKHGDKLLAASRFAEAREAGRRALGIRPFDELAVRLVMLSASYGGDQAGGLAAYHEFTTQLAAIGEKPSRELTALAERIRKESSRPPPRPEDAEPPLVGRERIYQEAFSVLTDALAQGPGTLVVIGAPGMGRSRLLVEAATRLVREGEAVVAQARPLESDHDAPWSTLRLLMRGGLSQAPGLVGADPADLGILAGLVPDLASRVTPRQALDAAQVAAALKAVLVAVAEEKPLALVIDDAHLADGMTLGALRAAVEGLPRVPVALVVSALDPADGAPREWLELRGAVGRGLRGATVRLDPVSDADLRRLVDALGQWCKEDADRDRLVRRLSYETSGNPFFAVTLLRGLAHMATFREDFAAWPPKGNTFQSPMISLPDLTRTAIAARVSLLSKESQKILEAASLCGLALDLDLLATLTELPRAQVDDHVTQAERRHLVRWDGERYAFAAPLIAEVVRNESLTPGQRTTLTRRAITALSTRTDFDARVLIAELKARAHPGPDSFDEAAGLTREAIEGAGARTARRALAAAQRAAGKAPTAGQRETIHALQAAIGQLTG